MLTDKLVLDAICEILDGQEWDPDTCDRIAEVIEESGRTIHEPLSEEERRSLRLNSAIYNAAEGLRRAAYALACWWDTLYALENLLKADVVEGDMVTSEACSLGTPASWPSEIQPYIDSVKYMVDEALVFALAREVEEDAEPYNFGCEPE